MEDAGRVLDLAWFSQHSASTGISNRDALTLRRVDLHGGFDGHRGPAPEEAEAFAPEEAEAFALKGVQVDRGEYEQDRPARILEAQACFCDRPTSESSKVSRHARLRDVDEALHDASVQAGADQGHP